MLQTNLVDQIFEIIRDRIISMQYEFGRKIDISNLADEFNISSTPVRDALNRLSQCGLVVVKPRVGYYVLDPSERDISEIYDLRKTLESFALESAIHNIPTEEWTNLKKELQIIQHKKSEKTRKRKFHEHDNRLHVLIIQGSNNRWLKDIFSNVYDIVRISISMGLEWKESMKEHVLLINALFDHDLERSRTILEKHIDNSKANAIKLMQRKEI